MCWTNRASACTSVTTTGLFPPCCKLRDLGNSVIVVEHDEDTIRAADHILDIGPGAGPRGGRLVAQGTLEEVLRVENSPTAQYLTGRLTIAVPRRRHQPLTPPPKLTTGKTRVPAGESNTGWLEIIGATENNLQNVHAAFPLGCLTCVTGVSGSGKSTLVDDISAPCAGASALPREGRARQT